MVRSLYAGISGLRSHQVALDVTGNNIANVNTVGFKSGRATFKESMAQMLQGPSRPAGNQSGTNPLQIGLGTSIASIDTMLRQGNMQTTGQITDLAIEGRAYFAFSSGNGTFYSRNGGLHLDADGYLVSPTTGWRLQGKMADTFGNYAGGSSIGDLRIPWGEKAPARATTQVAFGCNLDSGSREVGTITHTNSFLRSAALGTGEALAEVLDTSDYEHLLHTVNSIDTPTFVAATLARSIENEISTSYRTIENNRNRIELHRDRIAEIGELLGSHLAPYLDLTSYTNSDISSYSVSDFDDLQDLLDDIGTTSPPTGFILDNINAANTLLGTIGTTFPPRPPAGDPNEAAYNQLLTERTELLNLRTQLTTDIRDITSLRIEMGGDDSRIVAPFFNNGLVEEIGVLATEINNLWDWDWNFGDTVSDGGRIRELEADLAVLRGIIADQQSNEISSIANRTLLSSLFNENGNNLGIKGGDVITMQTGDDKIPAFKFTVLRDSEVPPEGVMSHVNYPLVGRTLEDLRKAMEGYLNALTTNFPDDLPNKERTALMNERVANYVNGVYSGPDGTASSEDARGAITIDYNSDGSFRINNNTGDPNRSPRSEEFSIPRFGVGSSRPGSNGYVADVFSFKQPIHSLHATHTVTVPRTELVPDPMLLDPPTFAYILDPLADSPIIFADMAKRALGASSSGAILIPAAADDRLSNLLDSKGQSLNLMDGDEIKIGGTVGVRGRTGGLEYTSELTLEELLIEMQNAYNLPPTDGTIYERPSISIKQAGDGADENIPLGSIILRGIPGEAFKLEGLSVIAKDNNISDPPPPTAFGSNMSFEYVQFAKNADVRTIDGLVYDQSGEEHKMIVNFIPLQQPGEWMWEISMAGEQRILGGNTGKVTFVNGTPSSVTFDDNSNSFRFDPMNGSDQVDIKLDFGAPRSKEGITQYKSPTSTEFKYQDGYPMGKLEEIFIDEKGEIAGKYTNAVVKAIGQVYLAEFNNPAGLLKHGNSMFAVSPNSGQAVLHQPGVGTPSTIKPGALEMSNVELETEFTNMITIQRGYQANARVITTSDSMLQELVQLVR